MPHPPELIVTVEKVNDDPQDDQFLAVTSQANGAEVCRNTFRFQSNLLVDFEPQWMLEKAVPRHAGEAIKRGPADATRSDDQEKKLAEYGRRLYGLLFGDGAKLTAFLEYNDAYRSQARLTLALHGNAATLWRLPWEYLHDEKDFLALTGRLLLSRMPYGLGRLDPAAAAPPLRVLVVVSAPDDQRPLDTEEEIGVIQRALDDAVRGGRVQVEYLDDATLPAIGDALRRFRPHVLHYTGHGYYDKAKAASFLALEDDDGCTRLAGIADLRPLLRDDPDLRLALLSGCQTAQTSDVDAFAGVATGLLAEAVPAVLAMQYSILDQSGITLAAAFYAALAEGAGPIEAAQRVRIALWQDREGPGYDWGIPALYLHAPEMRLVQTSKVSETFEVSPRAPPRRGRAAVAAALRGPQGRAAPTAPRDGVAARHRDVRTRDRRHGQEQHRGQTDPAPRRRAGRHAGDPLQPGRPARYPRQARLVAGRPRDRGPRRGRWPPARQPPRPRRPHAAGDGVAQRQAVSVRLRQLRERDGR